MSETTPSAADSRSADAQPAYRKDLRFWLDMAMKLTVPIGALVGVWLAHGFEERQSVRALMNQREQSESNLRATMFGQLIGPIADRKQGEPMDPARYALLVQLLALNFHEHFEFRPLMQHADDALKAAHGMTPAQAQAMRDALRSVAHRIIDRQVANLGAEQKTNCSPSGPGHVTFWLFARDVTDEQVKLFRGNNPADNFSRLQGETFEVSAPNCKDALTVAFANLEPGTESVDVFINRRGVATQVRPAGGAGATRGFISGALAKDGQGDVAQQDTFQFTLTPFSFPFTDNTPLADGNRFAVFVRDMTGTAHQSIMRVELRWFPDNYYQPTERPTDYRVVREALGVSRQGTSHAP